MSDNCKDCREVTVLTKQGVAGPQGKVGPPGTPGNDGIGTQGSTGATGAAGVDGADGVVDFPIGYPIPGQTAPGDVTINNDNGDAPVATTFTIIAATPADLTSSTLNTSSMLNQPLFQGTGKPKNSMLSFLFGLSLNTNESVVGVKPVVAFALDLQGVFTATSNTAQSYGVQLWIPNTNDVLGEMTARAYMNGGILTIQMQVDTKGALKNISVGAMILMKETV